MLPSSIRRPIRCWLPALAALFVAACGAPQAPPATDAAAANPTPAAPAAAPWQVEDWPLPVDGGAQPDLIATPDGGLLLSWIESRDGLHALKFAQAGADGRWRGAPRAIAQGHDWFVNWADTPHLAVSADGALWAHWLRKSGDAPYAYDVVLVRSADGGAHWSAPLAVNDDGTPTEHGFVSLWAEGADAMRVAWLDGRASGKGQGHGEHAGHGGAMTLRSARFGADLQRSGEAVLDTRTCDCCQTDAVATARGALLVYRDRGEQEVRDIAAARLIDGAWTPPQPVHADGWVMPGCPVNGPAVAAQGERALVAWYTGAGEAPSLRIATSADAGGRFGAPLTLDRGEAVQGRVDLALDADQAWVLWMREDRGGQSLQLARLAPDLSQERQRLALAQVRGRGRGTGFPQLALAGGAAYAVWTDLVDGRPRLRGARVQPEATVRSKGESNIAAGAITGSSSGTRSP
ncbi:glycoside hydrolase [Lysobacter sp. BMK333-48F3]|uniref:sialidase family protein n=1 Tax=Lysobacter sp. BMK333-48F3 TaxID=2867962 RepID=UPI001C8C6EE3|nr:sialidase family protein [Lysobacter sp. BMK333-48F3]MBX9401118.1 glycoside hydrolase [Lysobacter sp. BMK333-48F3]